MGLITTIKRWLSMFFRSEAEQAFNVDTIESPVMDTVIKSARLFIPENRRGKM